MRNPIVLVAALFAIVIPVKSYADLEGGGAGAGIVAAVTKQDARALNAIAGGNIVLMLNYGWPKNDYKPNRPVTATWVISALNGCKNMMVDEKENPKYGWAGMTLWRCDQQYGTPDKCTNILYEVSRRKYSGGYLITVYKQPIDIYDTAYRQQHNCPNLPAPTMAPRS